MPVSPQKDAFINKIWFSCFLASWVSTGFSRRRGGQGGLGAFPRSKGRGECTTGAYTARKIFEARPAPGTRQAGPPLPAMCRPRRCCRGATAAGGDLGDSVSGGFGLQGRREGGYLCVELSSWPQSCHQPNIPLGRVQEGCRWGISHPRVTGGPSVGKQQFGVVWVWECGRSPPGCRR